MMPAVNGVTPGKVWAFEPSLKCCTFNPILPNFLAGRALLRGGQSRSVVEARIREGTGVRAMGIVPPRGWVERYQRARHHAFGHAAWLRCPYAVEGQYGCGIWKDRNNVCRTWFCRYDGGAHGRSLWRAVKDVLSAAEQVLAGFCVREGRPPPKRAKHKQTTRWYRWCARRVEAMEAGEIEQLRTHPELGKRLEKVRTVAASPPGPMPEIVVTSVGGAEPDGEGVWVFGYSRYDGLLLPRSIFLFFSKLDGEHTWAQALAETNAEADQPLDPSVPHDLYRIGGIRSPEPGDLPGPGDDEPTFELTEDGGFFFRALM